MRLLHARVRHYRVHQDIEVDFHANTSLLGGTNEAGKSTLVEAMHRALFLPAKGDTKVHKGMRREGSGERPEVLLRFEHRGQEWELHKRFGGAAAHTVTLKRSGHPTLEGDEAEDMIAEITGAKLPEGKRASDDTVRLPWSHLWVWQGVAGDEPSKFIDGTTDDLVRITAQGAGAVLMSDVDGRLAGRFREARDATYDKAGTKVLKGSALGKADTHLGEVERDVDDLGKRVVALGADADRYADARERLARDEPKSVQVLAELKTLAVEIAAGETVELQRDKTRGEHRRLRELAEARRGEEGQLGGWEKRIAALTTALEGDPHAARHEESMEQAVRSRDAAEREVTRARGRLGSLVAERERAAARADLLRVRKELRGVEDAAARIGAIEGELETTDAELARLPSVPDGAIARLREQAGTIDLERARLEAVSSTLQVLRARLPLTLDGRTVEAGRPIDLEAETVIDYGDELSLKLVVPGASGAEALRASIAASEAAFGKSLGRFVIGDAVVTSIDQLVDVVPRRQALDARREGLRQRLEGENPVKVKVELQQARQDLIAAEALDRDRPEHADWSDPQDLPAARALDARRAEACREQAAQAVRLEAEHRTAITAVERAEERRQAHARTRLKDEDELKGARILCDNLLRDHGGDPDAFRRSLTELEAREATAERAAVAAQQALDVLALDVLQTRHARQSSQLEQLRAAIEAARDAMNESRGRLHQDDGSDPCTELRRARERLRLARAVHDHEALEARATVLLNELFQEEIDAANERITRPLADRVGHYLRRIFGATVEVELGYENGKFGEFYLRRPGFAEHEESFASLSGGAREQVAAAVRLATAELLACDHGGTLPVVFDDAFVNTDPGRIEGVIDMLFYAGEQGLQVIVSTCDPERYQNIGQVRWKIGRGLGAEVV